MQFRYISIPRLIAEAGGDPWAIDQSLQAGQAAQISDLAAAFHAAGQCTAESHAAFDEARNRFELSWNHEHGKNPINTSREVERTTQALSAQAKQLPEIGISLAGLAVALSEAQRSARQEIAKLENELRRLDDLLGQALDQEKDSDLTSSDRDTLNAFITLCEDDAIQDTQSCFDELRSIRRDYTTALHKAQTTLAQNSYDPGRVSQVDAHETQTPDQAQRDVAAALGGDEGAAARINAQLRAISTDQLCGKVPLSAEQAAVLSQLQAQEHGMSVVALQVATQNLGEQKGMMSDSWQLMSNPHLIFPKTPLIVGATQRSETIQGGADKLPVSVQQVLTEPDLIDADQTKTIADIVKDGNPVLQVNTALDRGLLDKSAQLMDTPLWQQHNFFQAQISSVFAATARDHAAINWLLNQHNDTAARNFLKNITHHAWPDGGTAPGALLSWTQNPSAAETDIAGRTAHNYATYLGENSQELLHLPGNHTLGQVNPRLVQAMSHGLGRYVNNIADTSGGLPEFGDPLTHAKSLPSDQISVAKGIFSVLASDKEAHEYFSGQAYAQALLHDNAFANNPLHPSYSHQLYDSATLRAFVDVGTHNAFQANNENGYHQGVSEYESKKSAYETGVLSASTVARFIPGVGTLAAPAIVILGHSLANDFLGTAPDAPTGSTIQHLDIGNADREILDSLLATQHTITGLPPSYIAHDHDHPYGRVAGLDELRQTQPGLSPGEYGEVIGPALAQTLQPRSPGELPLDQYMADRYNDIVGVPRPPSSNK
ncbi:MAG: hypothetical protein K2Q25_12385 [Mycobacteriaceae bacterium]|nr:hypothetical protein [Mycobacteriaceae bacterium]